MLRLLIVCFASSFLIGCGSSAEPVPPLADAKGLITLNGEPLKGATVAFTPAAATGESRGRTSTGATDDNGQFTLAYNSDYKGAIIGEHTVSVSKLEGTPEEPGGEMIPPQYNVKSQLKETVTEDGPNEFTIALTSKKKR